MDSLDESSILLAEEIEGQTQESFTQLSQPGELTQPGPEDDDNEADHPAAAANVDPLVVPWGRLMAVDAPASRAVELTPRPPARSRTPSPLRRRRGEVEFLGLKRLRPWDRFNEYVLGRSVKCDVTVQKKIPSIPSKDNSSNEGSNPINEGSNSSNEDNSNLGNFVHAMISNRHCRLFCLLRPSQPPEMEVFVEDTSGNGTLVNGTTLLRRHERRKLHTGDVLCLIHPRLLAKKLRSPAERRSYMAHYSYVFVNLHQQEARHAGVVDARATRCSPDRPPLRRIEHDYDLRDLLGTGTCGEVRRAIHRRTGDERAVKILQPGPLPFTAVQAEAAMLRSLDHPYVVRLFDVYTAPGKAIYLVMELLQGGDLFDRIVQRGKYDECQARRVMRRILAAVHYLHETRDVVHRDLKPENILLLDRQSDVSLKLTDFGLAKSITPEGLKTFCGTPQYFAPEVLRRRHSLAGKGRYGKEADCWSIGVILFILLSGSPPFDVSAGFDHVAKGRVHFFPDQWEGVSKSAIDLVRKLLEVDPKKRISVADACDHDWVLTEDGDTHSHPLQDPVVLESLNQNKNKHAGDDTTLSGNALITNNQSKRPLSPSRKDRTSPNSLRKRRKRNSPILPTSTHNPMNSHTAQQIIEPHPNDVDVAEVSAEMTETTAHSQKPSPRNHSSISKIAPTMDAREQLETSAKYESETRCRSQWLFDHSVKKSLETSFHDSVDKSLQKSFDDSAEKLQEKLFDDLVEKLPEKAFDSSVKRSLEKSFDNLVEKPLDKSLDDSVGKSLEKSFNDSAEKSSEIDPLTPKLTENVTSSTLFSTVVDKHHKSFTSFAPLEAQNTRKADNRLESSNHTDLITQIRPCQILNKNKGETALHAGGNDKSEIRNKPGWSDKENHDQSLSTAKASKPTHKLSPTPLFDGKEQEHEGHEKNPTQLHSAEEFTKPTEFKKLAHTGIKSNSKEAPPRKQTTIKNWFRPKK